MADNKKVGTTVEVSDAVGFKFHEYATHISVQEGHLLVGNGASHSDVVVIYAPGKWKNATVSR